MKKVFMFIPLSLLLHTSVSAQDESSKNSAAAQSARLELSNGIDISYMTTGNGTGTDASMQFNNPNDFTSGVASGEQELRVRSNKTFKVAVRCDANSFGYQGSSSNTMNTLPDNALQIKVTGNNTGGTVKAPFSTTNFAALSSDNQDILVDGHNGGNQTFSVMYKCKPGFNLPAGTYNMNVVFTATQE